MSSLAHLSSCHRAILGRLCYPPPWGNRRPRCSVSPSADSGGDGGSYLDMWKKAVERERRATVLRHLTQETNGEGWQKDNSLDRKTELFNKILEVPREERDRVQRLQIIDRAAAAIAAARALVEEFRSEDHEPSGENRFQGNKSSLSDSQTSTKGAPGPDFWSWSPPATTETQPADATGLFLEKKASSLPNLSNSVMEKEHEPDILPVPFQSTLSASKHYPPLPPLQSIVEAEKRDGSTSTSKLHTKADKNKVDVLFSQHAAEAVEALRNSHEPSAHGVNPDGSKWWRETGIERRPDGVVCKWTLTRGISADESIEWEDKFWEAAGRFNYKELGSEKSGRDAAGNVWREYWKESMWQDIRSGLMYLEKTADKWGKNGKGEEWQEKWWEHYDASGQAEKWAHKWCSIDPNTPLEAGHAHVWHERWGEKYDGRGGSTKYTDKWAERSEGDGWSRWGDKWDENFDPHGHGVKQGETWWQGKYKERWNRTWGEQHNGSGWVHKYGKSSSGEHWDTHAQQDTWYEQYPHYGFWLCFQNSVQLRAVRKPPEVP